MSLLIMHAFGDVPEASITWAHNGNASEEFIGVPEPAYANREEGYFRRYELLRDHGMARPLGARLSYLDNDAVKFRRKVLLEPDLGSASIGAVWTNNPKIPFNCGALYVKNSAQAWEFLDRVLALKAECLAIGDGHADEHAFARVAMAMPGVVIDLDPAWNNWIRAVGERHIPTVVQAFHSLKGETRIAAVRESVALSVRMDL